MNRKALSNIDLWILDVISIAPVELNSLLEETKFSAVNYGYTYYGNRENGDVFDSVQKLVAEHFITLSVNGNFVYNIKNDSQFHTFLSNCIVSITPSGGAAWEEWSKPKWSLYFEDTWEDVFTINDDTSFQLISVECSCDDRFLDICQYLRDMAGNDVYASEDKLVLAPWCPTSWKKLESGLSRKVLLRNSASTVPMTEKFKHFRKWCLRGFSDRAISRMP